MSDGSMYGVLLVMIARKQGRTLEQVQAAIAAAWESFERAGTPERKA